MQASSLNKTAVRLSATIVLAALLGAGGCSPEYEIDRPGTWQPTGANEHNLRAMVADPRDLSYGAATATDRGTGASRAVTRLLTDRRRPLLNATLSKIAPGGQESQDAPLGAGAPSGAAATAGPAQ